MSIPVLACSEPCSLVTSSYVRVSVKNTDGQGLRLTVVAVGADILIALQHGGELWRGSVTRNIKMRVDQVRHGKHQTGTRLEKKLHTDVRSFLELEQILTMGTKGDTDRHDDDDGWKENEREMQDTSKAAAFGDWGAVAWLLGGEHVRPCD